MIEEEAADLEEGFDDEGGGEDDADMMISLNAISDEESAQILGCHLEYTTPMVVCVADGNKIVRGDWLRLHNPIEFDYDAMTVTISKMDGGLHYSDVTDSQLQALLQSYSDIFREPEGLPPDRCIQHQIRLKPNAEPKRMAPYRHLNSLTVKHNFSISVIDELLDELHGASYFSKIDLRSGYFQIKMQPSDVFKTVDEHLQHLNITLGLLCTNQLFAKMSKCSFGKQIVEYLGHVITPTGVSTDPEKVACMQAWPAPKNVKELRGFLGLTDYYRKFVQNYGLICKLLTDLLKKDGFLWTPAATLAFEALKTAMSTTPVLALPNFSKTFVVETDASDKGVGMVLMQSGRPIAYLSKALGVKNQALSVYEKEFLAIMLAVGKWKHYLEGNKFIIKTDQQSLKFILEQCIGNALQQKWISKLLGLDYEIHYKKGCENKVADTLSRFLHGECSVVTLVVPNWISEIQQSYINDDLYKPIVQAKTIQPAAHPDYTLQAGVFTKYAHFLGLSLPYSAETVARLFLDNVYKLHGLPLNIVTDRDKIFTSQFWSTLFKALNIQLSLTTAYHTQEDGQTERVNQCLETYLWCMCHLKPKSWAKWLPLAEHWYNTNFHQSLRTTPFEALYGYAPTPFSLELYIETDHPVDGYLKDRHKMIELFKSNLHEAQNRMKHYADKKRTERVFQVGDSVYLRLQPYRQNSVQLGQNLKLAPRYYGPFLVEERIGAILGRRSIQRVKTSVPQVLIHWANYSPEEATWEDYYVMKQRFPDFDSNPCGQGSHTQGPMSCTSKKFQ
ncbi:UNVERIFIED_CONTAM: Retrovirus-related Pol polyprotein from transposon.6 [Sesamum latifolium]|uniref:Retrovirus-related Pol polyprotein from transposon.6 n=1 Tax=Sesamum latifolium TaxID=2727402 RepID=A0AAW2X6W2_9LAMI